MTNEGLLYVSWYFGTLQAEVVHADDISHASEEPVSRAARKLMLPSWMTAKYDLWKHCIRGHGRSGCIYSLAITR